MTNNDLSPRPDDESGRRRRHHRDGWGGAPVGAIILLVLGVVLLAQNFGLRLPENWWAFFLLIPAAGSFVAAIRHYREAGDSVNGDVIGSLIATAIFVALWAAFFFGFDWGLLWPIVLIAAGLGLLARDYWPRGQ